MATNRNCESKYFKFQFYKDFRFILRVVIFYTSSHKTFLHFSVGLTYTKVVNNQEYAKCPT